MSALEHIPEVQRVTERDAICLGVASFTADLRSGRMGRRTFLELAAQLGFGWIELCDRTVSDTDEDLKSLSSEISGLGLRIACIDIRNDFTYRDEAALEAAVAHVTRWIALCGRLEVGLARVWVGNASVDDGAFRRAATCLQRVMREAEHCGVRLALENHGGISQNPDALLRLVDWVGSPHLGVCADFGWLTPTDRLPGLKKLIPAAIHIHAKAHGFQENGAEPEIDYEVIGDYIRRCGYKGFFNVEYEGPAEGRQRIDGVMKTVKLVEKNFFSKSDKSEDRDRQEVGWNHVLERTPTHPAPYIGRIRTRNLWQAARPPMLKLAHWLAEQPQTCGVVILGGLADRDERRFIDRHSDLDLAVFVTIPEAAGYLCPKQFSREHPDLIPAWLPNFEFQQEVQGELLDVNCHQLILEIEQHPSRSWSTSKQEAYLRTGEVIFDPDGAISRLINSKCLGEPDEAEVATLASQLPWYGWLNPVRQLERGFPCNARMLLNQAVEVALKLVYASNGHHWPHMKWQFEMAKDLAWLPQEFEKHLNRIFAAGTDASDLAGAIRAMQTLGVEVLDRLCATGRAPRDCFRYVTVHIDPDRQLLTRTSADRVTLNRAASSRRPALPAHNLN